MINREYISDLKGMRHTDFGYFAGGGNVQEANQPVAIDAGVQRQARTALAPTVNLAVDGRPEQEMESTKYRGESRLGINERPAASIQFKGKGRGGSRW